MNDGLYGFLMAPHTLAEVEHYFQGGYILSLSQLERAGFTPEMLQRLVYGPDRDARLRQEFYPVALTDEQLETLFPGWQASGEQFSTELGTWTSLAKRMCRWAVDLAMEANRITMDDASFQQWLEIARTAEIAEEELNAKALEILTRPPKDGDPPPLLALLRTLDPELDRPDGFEETFFKNLLDSNPTFIGAWVRRMISLLVIAGTSRGRGIVVLKTEAWFEQPTEE